MSIRLQQSDRSASFKTKKENNFSAKVWDVILDENNENVDDLEGSETESKNTAIVGYVIVRKADDSFTADTSLISYPPLFPDEGIPLRGETVDLVEIGNRKYYKRKTNSNLNLGNTNSTNFFNKKEDTTSSSTYSQSSSTKSPQGGSSANEPKIPGEYFSEQQVNPLKLYEGDKLLQSRFGQSIRFSGYNNADNSFSPTILIRNRQNSEIEQGSSKSKLIEEDVNKDGSIIAITSGDYEIKLSPGTLDDNGSQKMETTPKVFESFPSEFKGLDQILINTGRLILSSKTDEMIFFSKGNYGFISDGKFSIDNGKAGAELDFNGEFRMTMNDNPTYLLGQGTSGKIFLNIEAEDEPLVRGETLKKLLTQLIDEILKMVWATPAGPTSPGPLPPHVQKLNQIKKDLQTMLSTTNFTE
jgi:hypothetical protein